MIDTFGTTLADYVCKIIAVIRKVLIRLVKFRQQKKYKLSTLQPKKKINNNASRMNQTERHFIVRAFF